MFFSCVVAHTCYEIICPSSRRGYVFLCFLVEVMGSPRPVDMHTPGLQKTSSSVPEVDRISGLLSAGIVQRDDDKIPLFLLKLWNIIEDPNFGEIIQWDDVS